jgi:hypothetical protein
MQDQSGNNLGRVRVKALYIVPAAGAGSVVFKDGGASGSTKMTVNTLASSTAPYWLLFPGEGLLFQTDVYATVTTVASVLVMYG